VLSQNSLPSLIPFSSHIPFKNLSYNPSSIKLEILNVDLKMAQIELKVNFGWCFLTHNAVEAKKVISDWRNVSILQFLNCNIVTLQLKSKIFGKYIIFMQFINGQENLFSRILDFLTLHVFISILLVLFVYRQNLKTSRDFS